MKLRLDRAFLTDKSTIGRLFVDDVFQCFTLEDAQREVEGKPVKDWKIHGETAIPKGTYQIIIDYSQRFKKDLPRLLDVPGFEGVRIHSGNGPADTEGCILVGTNYVKDRVNNSRTAFMPLMTLLEQAYDISEPITIEVS